MAPRPRIRDPDVRRAIDAIVAAPDRPWSVASLARVAGLSRTAFAARFKRASGISPERWLTRHRLRMAAWQLLSGDDSLATIAQAVGYQCGFSLSKAFKRVIGVTPSHPRAHAASARITPVAPWTVATLAEEVGLSRSVFAARRSATPSASGRGVTPGAWRRKLTTRS